MRTARVNKMQQLQRFETSEKSGNYTKDFSKDSQHTEHNTEHKFNKYQVEDARNAPEKKFVSGPVSAAIWQNQAAGKNGVVNFRTVSFQRVYKDKNGKWQNSNTLRVNDLPRAMLVLQKAYEYLAIRDTNNNPDYEPEVVEEII